MALKYKDLWMVETFFRSLKSIMENRPIFHKCDETVRGHVFCGFPALVLFQMRMAGLEDSTCPTYYILDITYYETLGLFNDYRVRRFAPVKTLPSR